MKKRQAIRKILSKLNDGQITVSQALEEVMCFVDGCTHPNSVFIHGFKKCTDCGHFGS